MHLTPINSAWLYLPRLPMPINILPMHDTIINRAQQLLPRPLMSSTTINTLSTCLTTAQQRLSRPRIASMAIKFHATHYTIINRAQWCLSHPPTFFPRTSPLLGDIFRAHQRPLWPSTLFSCAPPRPRWCLSHPPMPSMTINFLSTQSTIVNRAQWHLPHPPMSSMTINTLPTCLTTTQQCLPRWPMPSTAIKFLFMHLTVIISTWLTLSSVRTLHHHQYDFYDTPAVPQPPIAHSPIAAVMRGACATWWIHSSLIPTRHANCLATTSEHPGQTCQVIIKTTCTCYQIYAQGLPIIHSFISDLQDECIVLNLSIEHPGREL